MRDGRVERIASPGLLCARPVSTFAAGFAGDPPMAMIEDAALGLEGRTVGIRPEHVGAVASGAADLVGTVGETEFLGAESPVVICHPAACGLVATGPGRVEAQAGQTIGRALPWNTGFSSTTARAEAERTRSRIAGNTVAKQGPATAARHLR
jgi:sn-glycerol 3-phosphate transport system ATP-binding protein